MKRISGIAAALLVFLISCNTGNDVKSEQESYQLTKEQLLIKEQKNPAGFLLVSGNDKRNLVGQTVIKGKITNIATVAVFKDIDIQLAFYSKTKAILETDKETIFEKLNPGESKEFKTKYFAPKGTDSVAMVVLGAKLAE